MPFSRSRTWTASTISFDMVLALQQVASLDVGVRDRDDAVVGGDRHRVVGRPDELAREALLAAVLVARAHARTTADVAAEVVRLGERALGPGRGDLEPDLGQ